MPRFTFTVAGPGVAPDVQVTLELQDDLEARTALTLVSTLSLAVQSTLTDALATFEAAYEAALPAPAPAN